MSYVIEEASGEWHVLTPQTDIHLGTVGNVHPGHPEAGRFYAQLEVGDGEYFLPETYATVEEAADAIEEAS